MTKSTERTFTGRTAIISGGLGDIGRSIARQLAEKGANIALGDKQPAENASDFLSTLRANDVKAIYTELDVSDADQVREWVDACTQELGIPDVVIANAAIVTLATVHELTTAQWDNELQVNLSGPFYLAKLATEKMVGGRLPGHVVLVGSWAAHVVHPHIPAYSVSKAGLRMLGKCLALELAPHGIQVNEIAPGYVDAGLTAQIWKANPSLKEQSMGKVPLNRLIGADEVAAQAVHLCEQSNRHMTGSTLLMDGGLSMLSV